VNAMPMAQNTAATAPTATRTCHADPVSGSAAASARAGLGLTITPSSVVTMTAQ
jgi:hypothetical protein